MNFKYAFAGATLLIIQGCDQTLADQPQFKCNQTDADFAAGQKMHDVKAGTKTTIGITTMAMGDGAITMNTLNIVPVYKSVERTPEEMATLMAERHRVCAP